MSNSPNPVQSASDAQPKTSVPYGRNGKPMALRQMPDGTFAQVVVNALDPVSAQVNLDSRSALTLALKAVSDAIGGTGGLSDDLETLTQAVNAGTAAQEASNQETSALGSGVAALKASIDTGNTMTTTSNTKLEALHADLSGTIHTDLAALLTKLNGGIGVTGTFWPSTQPVSGTFWQATQPVSLASVPLASGASTETTLAAVLAAIKGTLTVSGSFYPASQPVTGTFWQAVQPVSATAWPLPAGASTEATSASILSKLNASVAVTGTFWPTTQPISAAALPLPAGAATETTLGSLGAKLDTLHADLLAIKPVAESPLFKAFTAIGQSSQTFGQVSAASRITGILLSAPSSLLGNILGGTVAQVDLFHTAATGTAYSATDTGASTPLGSVSVAAGQSVWLEVRLDVPATRFLRVQSSAGGVNVTLTVRSLP